MWRHRDHCVRAADACIVTATTGLTQLGMLSPLTVLGSVASLPPTSSLPHPHTTPRLAHSSTCPAAHLESMSFRVSLARAAQTCWTLVQPPQAAHPSCLPRCVIAGMPEP